MFNQFLKKPLILMIAVLLVIFVGLAAYLSTYLKPFNSSDQATTQFIIPKGQSISAIGQRLYEAHLIKHPLVFRFVVVQQDIADKIQSGSFTLSASMTPYVIAETLTKGTDDIWLTVLEGWRAEEIAAAVEKLSLPLFNATDFLSLAKTDEGRLFPDTYLIPKEYTAEDIYSLLTNTFEKKVTQGLSSQIAASDRSFADALVMASLIEREARGYDEMRHVAGILWNRYDIGMALQVDASLQYLEGYNNSTKSWWSPPNPATKSLRSPFNTYAQLGLPPRPIANPGLDAMKAALNPLDTQDLYYLHSSDGQIYYAQDLKEHNANIQRYLR